VRRGEARRERGPVRGEVEGGLEGCGRGRGGRGEHVEQKLGTAGAAASEGREGDEHAKGKLSPSARLPLPLPPSAHAALGHARTCSASSVDLTNARAPAPTAPPPPQPARAPSTLPLPPRPTQSGRSRPPRLAGPYAAAQGAFYAHSTRRWTARLASGAVTATAECSPSSPARGSAVPRRPHGRRRDSSPRARRSIVLHSSTPAPQPPHYPASLSSPRCHSPRPTSRRAAARRSLLEGSSATQSVVLSVWCPRACEA